MVRARDLLLTVMVLSSNQIPNDLGFRKIEEVRDFNGCED
jgi:hypothetical protein